MVYVQRMTLGLLVAGMVFAAEPGSANSTEKTPIVKIADSRAVAKSPSASEDAIVVATVRSSGGLILNGMPTPRGVNSVVVTRGDVVETVGAPAVAIYATGQSLNLAPLTSYQSLPDRLVPTITKPRPSGVEIFALPPVSVVKR